MELTEPIESINIQLKDQFGIDTITGLPIWRVVFSDDQLEKRYGTYDDFVPGTKIWLRQVTEVREVHKYKQWIHQKYILERMVVVPDINEHELPDTKVSYEVIWVFEDRNGGYLPPRFDAAKFIIDTIYAAQYSNHSIAKYKDPESTQENALQAKKERIDGIVEELFGDESGLLGTTITGESIIVPNNYKKDS